jgi:predicted membrane protein
VKTRGIFTAILLITIGVLCLLTFFEIVNLSWSMALRLWPLILIWIGVLFIPISRLWKLIIKILVLIFGVFLLIYYGNNHCCKYQDNCFHKSNIGEEKSMVKTVDVNDNEFFIFDVHTESNTNLVKIKLPKDLKCIINRDSTFTLIEVRKE